MSDPKTPLQAGRATARSAVEQKVNGDLKGAFDLVGRYLFGEETLRQVAGIDPPSPPSPGSNVEALVTPPLAPKEEPCSFCGTAPDGDIADRFIIRKDKKQIPCPGCLGRK
jgi:hypothetical protein